MPRASVNWKAVLKRRVRRGVDLVEQTGPQAQVLETRGRPCRLCYTATRTGPQIA